MIRVVLDEAAFRDLVRGEVVTGADGVEIILADLGARGLLCLERHGRKLVAVVPLYRMAPDAGRARQCNKPRSRQPQS